MFLVSRLAIIIGFLLVSMAAGASTPPLRVCADPNNLPFSNMREQGFENVLARMIGHDLQREVEFVWWPQRARFVEKRLKAQTCDLVMGVVSSSDLLQATQPYYRSTYVFVSRRDRGIHVASLTDNSLKQYRIGAQLIGDDDAAVPPAQELANRGMLRNIVGFSLYGHLLEDNPSSEVIIAVERRDVDLAVAWGAMAGYFAKKCHVPLELTPICPLADKSAQPFVFDISMGVRRGDDLLREQLNRFIDLHQKDIRSLLQHYGVLTLEKTSSGEDCR